MIIADIRTMQKAYYPPAALAYILYPLQRLPA